MDLDKNELPEDLGFDNTLVVPPETEEGNIEYKWKLVDPGPNRLEHLVTQMKWRLNEGNGEAIYRLGVEDDGRMVGLEPDELNSSLQTIHQMALRLNATVETIQDHYIQSPSKPPSQRRAVDLLIRQSPSHNLGLPTINVAVLGGVDAGKSTLIGVITEGQLDNACGKSRVNLFRHLHEVQTGRTSCLSNAQLGFNQHGSITNYTRTGNQLHRVTSLDELVRSSSQLITLFDLAGHSKYQRTSLSGLCRGQPSCALLVVPASQGLNEVGLEHLQLTLALHLPLAIVFTKLDQIASSNVTTETLYNRLIKPHLDLISSFSDLTSTMSSSSPYRLEDQNDKRPANTLPVSNLPVPVFAVSNVNGQGIEQLTLFLSQLAQTCQLLDRRSLLTHSSSMSNLPSSLAQGQQTRQCSQMLTRITDRLRRLMLASSTHRPSCFWVNDVFTRVAGVNDPVLVGSLCHGRLKCGSCVWLGPDKFGEFHLVEVTSIKYRHESHDTIFPGQTSSVVVHSVGGSRQSVSGPPITSKTTQSAVPVPFLAGLFNDDNNDEDDPPLSSSLPGGKPLRPCLKRTASNSIRLAEESSHQDNSRRLPFTIRRGMVLLDRLDLDSSQSAGVTWTIEVAIEYRLASVATTLNSRKLVCCDLPSQGQRLTVYAGCVVQGASVISCTNTNTSTQSSSNSRRSPEAFLCLKFSTSPEYINVNRPVILAWADNKMSAQRGKARKAKCVGHVSRLFDLIRPTNARHDAAPTQPGSANLDYHLPAPVAKPSLRTPINLALFDNGHDVASNSNSLSITSATSSSSSPASVNRVSPLMMDDLDFTFQHPPTTPSTTTTTTTTPSNPTPSTPTNSILPLPSSLISSSNPTISTTSNSNLHSHSSCQSTEKIGSASTSSLSSSSTTIGGRPRHRRRRKNRRRR